MADAVEDCSVDVSDSNISASSDNVRCEVLCFIQQKCGLISFDHLTKICADFFKLEEIISARNLIGKFTKKRVTMRQGPDISRTTVEDLLKICLDARNKLPTFFAVDLSRLPPVDIEHCDVSAILRELQVLRSEVRELVKLRCEIETLKSNNTLLAHSNMQTIEQEVSCCKAERANFVQKSDLLDLKRDILAEVQSLPTLSIGANFPLLETAGVSVQQASKNSQITQRLSYADHTKNLKDTGMKDTNRRDRKQVLGLSNKYKLSSVDTRRSIELFVTRFDSHTASGEIVECVSDILHGHPPDQISCIRLKSRQEFYASFHITVSVSSSSMKMALDSLMSAESWPTGILVRRFFKPKNNG